MESDLLTQADEYLSAFDVIPNPPPDILLDGFCEALQAGGHDLGEYTEEEWLDALERLGYAPEDSFGLMEQAASWAIVDVDTWVDPAAIPAMKEARARVGE